jgi:DNA repair exonuclease SbcCD ATPase subunit
MKIAKIIINNFRGITTETLLPDKINVLLGHCGTGKSSTMDAIKWGLTGKITKEDIRYDSPEASIKIIFDDGTSIMRTQSAKATNYVNEKVATEKATNEFLENKFGCSISSIEAMCGASFFKSLSKKDLKSFIIDILPIKASFSKIVELSDDLDEEKISFIKEYLEDEVSLADIDAAYKTVFDGRKVKKQVLKNLQEKSKFTKELPGVTKEELLKRQGEIALIEAKVNDYKKNLERYNKSLKTRENAEKQLADMKNRLHQYKDIKQPVEADLQLAIKEKQLFIDAIANANNTIAIMKANVELMQRTLDSLDKPVCPISERIVCTADKSGLREELISLVEMNNKELANGYNFIVRCNEQVDKRDEIINSYNNQLIAWNNKINLENTINAFALPEVLDKPEEVNGDFAEEKLQIQNMLNVWYEKDASDQAAKNIEETVHKVNLYDFAVKFFSANGIKSKLLEKAVDPLQKMIDEKTQSLRKGFKISLMTEEEFDITISPRTGEVVPLNKISAGEFIVTAYILMSVVSQITGVSILMMDNLDNLDSDAARQLMLLLDADENFNTIILASVDHPDIIDAISEVDCFVKEYM